ncbi:hypothetical protein NMY22_g20022 [Coprinellus aureogranulatus]|nr:hypothetical protein NMY22_g20022 [Coprinellus aureogranulatus]
METDRRKAGKELGPTSGRRTKRLLSDCCFTLHAGQCLESANILGALVKPQPVPSSTRHLYAVNDARMAGNEVEFLLLRSSFVVSQGSLHHSSLFAAFASFVRLPSSFPLRPLSFPLGSLADALCLDPQPSQPSSSQAAGDEETLKFGIFAARDFKEGGEVVLTWEWDDGNVVRTLRQQWSVLGLGAFQSLHPLTFLPVHSSFPFSCLLFFFPSKSTSPGKTGVGFLFYIAQSTDRAFVRPSCFEPVSLCERHLHPDGVHPSSVVLPSTAHVTLPFGGFPLSCSLSAYRRSVILYFLPSYDPSYKLHRPRSSPSTITAKPKSNTPTAKLPTSSTPSGARSCVRGWSTPFAPVSLNV